MKRASIHTSRMLHVLCRIAKRNNLRLFLDYGSLLGCIRTGSFIPWDSDGDVSVLVDTTEDIKNLASFYREVRKQGYAVREKRVARRRKLDSFTDGVVVRSDKAVVDLFVWCKSTLQEMRNWTPEVFKRTDLLLTHSPEEFYFRRRYNPIDFSHNKGLCIHPDWVSELQSATIDNLQVTIPKGAELLLLHRYGPDWRKPKAQKQRLAHFMKPVTTPLVPPRTPSKTDPTPTPTEESGTPPKGLSDALRAFSEPLDTDASRELRTRAKEAGVRNWWNKRVDKLLEELDGVEPKDIE